MSYTITLLTFDEEIEVEADETILEIAVEENIPYPYGCRTGNCGACKSRLVLGEVHMREHSSMALTADEAARGLILACRAEPRSDCTLAVLNYDDALVHPLKQLVGEVIAVTKLTHDIAAVQITLPEAMDYTAGQFAAVAFQGFPARDYSFASPPGAASEEDGQTIEFHIRRMGDDGVSAFVFDTLAPGEPVAVHGPMGYAFLREAETGPIIAIAGGSGLAPIRAILQSALSKPDAADRTERPVRLWFGARTEADVYLEDELKALAVAHPAFHYEIILSDPAPDSPSPSPSPNSPRRNGFVTDAFAADLASLGPGILDGARAYLAGPPPMVEAAIEVLKSAGLEQPRIHADAFYTEADKAALANDS